MGIKSAALADFYKQIRAKIEHEDDLVHQRITWMITLHGLLFAAYGFSLQPQATVLLGSEATRAGSAQFIHDLEKLRVGMAFAGVFVGVAVLAGVIAAFRAIRKDEAALRDALGNAGDEALLPLVIGPSMSNILGMVCGLLVPYVGVGAWIFVQGKAMVKVAQDLAHDLGFNFIDLTLLAENPVGTATLVGLGILVVGLYWVIAPGRPYKWRHGLELGDDPLPKSEVLIRVEAQVLPRP